MNNVQIGNVVILRGITQRGKNRINRGGMAWVVHEFNADTGMVWVASLMKDGEGHKMHIKHDQDNEIIELDSRFIPAWKAKRIGAGFLSQTPL